MNSFTLFLSSSSFNGKITNFCYSRIFNRHIEERYEPVTYKIKRGASGKEYEHTILYLKKVWVNNIQGYEANQMKF